jgi:hypothetical protein
MEHTVILQHTKSMIHTHIIFLPLPYPYPSVLSLFVPRSPILQAYKCRGAYSANFSIKTPGGGVHWHPGQRGHQLKGESIAMFVLAVLEDAVQVGV